MESIDRNGAIRDECEHLRAGLIEQRVGFDQTVVQIRSNESHVFSESRLFGAQSGNPCLRTNQSTPQWFNLPDIAAGEPRGFGIKESVYTLVGNQRFKIAPAGIQRSDAPAITLLRCGPELVRFIEQASGIERDYFHIDILFTEQVGNYLIFESEARREYDP